MRTIRSPLVGRRLKPRALRAPRRRSTIPRDPGLPSRHGADACLAHRGWRRFASAIDSANSCCTVSLAGTARGLALESRDLCALCPTNPLRVRTIRQAFRLRRSQARNDDRDTRTQAASRAPFMASRRCHDPAPPRKRWITALGVSGRSPQALRHYLAYGSEFASPPKRSSGSRVGRRFVSHTRPRTTRASHRQQHLRSLA